MEQAKIQSVIDKIYSYLQKEGLRYLIDETETTTFIMMYKQMFFGNKAWNFIIGVTAKDHDVINITLSQITHVKLINGHWFNYLQSLKSTEFWAYEHTDYGKSALLRELSLDLKYNTWEQYFIKYFEYMRNEPHEYISDILAKWFPAFED